MAFTFTTTDWLLWLELYNRSEQARQQFMDTMRAQHRTDNVSEVSGGLLRIISAWCKELDMWLTSFPTKKQQDLVALMQAEIWALENLIDPAAHAPSGYYPEKPTVGSDEFVEFRDRFYRLSALHAGMVRTGFSHIERLSSELESLDRLGQEKGWLP